MSVQRSETLPARRMRTTQEEIEAKEQELQKKEKQGHHTHTTWGTITLAYSSLGIIYGDIGTSPLYCFATTLYTLDAPEPADVLGVASLIFWIMTLIVLVKYVLIVLRADDNGEGGTFALYSLLCRSIGLTPFGAEVDKSDCGLSRYSSVPGSRVKAGRKALDTVTSCMSSHAVNRSMRHAFRHSRGLQMALLLTVVLATAMVVGDGILTPSISVMGAVEGLTVATDNISQDTITGISCVVLVLLFIGQRYGTSMVGKAFAPVVIIWLSMNACLGIYNLSVHGGRVFNSLNPMLIVDFFIRHGHQGWLMLGGVMLCITGAEAMYSDLGHFTKQAVSLGFITFVYPCLMLTYWGQGAYLLSHPEHAKEAFWMSVPVKLFWPFFVLAILASVVASQALISGAFSIMRQASALGLFPKMTIVHTGRKIEGQIYMPGVNYTLMVLCVAVTVGFQSTHSLGEAYGVAVMTVMTFTTLLVCLVMLMTWNLHPLLVALFVVVYLPLEGAFLSATLVKVPNGGWVALVVAAILGFFKMTWWWGTNKKHQHNIANKSHIYDILMEIDHPSNHKFGSFRCCSMLWNNLVPVKLPRRQVVLVATGEPVSRMPGLGVYYSETSGGVPAVMQHVLETMPALYSSMVFMTVRFVALPTVDKKERFLVRRDKTISSCHHATVRYGYLDQVDHSQAFMEDLVQVLLQHLLERRGVGSPGAAQRLISAIAAKAAARPSASCQGDMEGLTEGFAAGILADVSCDGAGGGPFGIAQTLTAAAAAVNSVAGADNSSPIPGGASGILSELLSQMTAADLLAILQPLHTSLSSRRVSIGRLTPTDKLCSGVGLAAAAGHGAEELLSLGGSGPAAVDALGCISIRVTREKTAQGTEAVPFSKEIGALELTPHTASVPRRASAQLGVEDSSAFEASENGVEAAQVACESAQAKEPKKPGLEEALRRLPSYWGQLRDAGKSAAGSLDSDSEEAEKELDEGQAQDPQLGQIQKLQQPAAPVMTPAAANISDITLPVSAAGNSSDAPRTGHRVSGIGTAISSADEIAGIGLVQLSNGQITALQEAVRLLEDYHRRWVHCIGRTTLKVLPGGRFAHKVALGGVYRFMATNSRQVTAAWNIPTNNLIELGMDVEV